MIIIPIILAVLLAGCAGMRTGSGRDGFVPLAEAVPDAILEIRHYSTYNFVGERIDGYEQPYALLSKEAAKVLKAASSFLLNLDNYFVESVVVFNWDGNRLAVHRRSRARPVLQVACL